MSEMLGAETKRISAFGNEERFSESKAASEHWFPKSLLRSVSFEWKTYDAFQKLRGEDDFPFFALRYEKGRVTSLKEAAASYGGNSMHDSHLEARTGGYDNDLARAIKALLTDGPMSKREASALSVLSYVHYGRSPAFLWKNGAETLRWALEIYERKDFLPWSFIMLEAPALTFPVISPTDVLRFLITFNPGAGEREIDPESFALSGWPMPVAENRYLVPYVRERTRPLTVTYCRVPDSYTQVLFHLVLESKSGESRFLLPKDVLASSLYKPEGETIQRWLEASHSVTPVRSVSYDNAGNRFVPIGVPTEPVPDLIGGWLSARVPHREPVSIERRISPLHILKRRKFLVSEDVSLIPGAFRIPESR